MLLEISNKTPNIKISDVISQLPSPLANVISQLPTSLKLPFLNWFFASFEVTRFSLEIKGDNFLKYWYPTERSEIEPIIFSRRGEDGKVFEEVPITFGTICLLGKIMKIFCERKIEERKTLAFCYHLPFLKFPGEEKVILVGKVTREVVTYVSKLLGIYSEVEGKLNYLMLLLSGFKFSINYQSKELCGLPIKDFFLSLTPFKDLMSEEFRVLYKGITNIGEATLKEARRVVNELRNDLERKIGEDLNDFAKRLYITSKKILYNWPSFLTILPYVISSLYGLNIKLSPDKFGEKGIYGGRKVSKDELERLSVAGRFIAKEIKGWINRKE